jgi:hypothetical protein
VKTRLISCALSCTTLFSGCQKRAPGTKEYATSVPAAATLLCNRFFHQGVPQAHVGLNERIQNALA